jgi:nucleoside 2-deoxyribosyltransferase
MFDLTPDGLVEIISHGESEKVEFKAYLLNDKAIARDLTAFANTQGGILLVGVEDSGEIVGLPEAEAEATIIRLRKLSSSLCNWTVHIGRVEVHGKQIVYLVIEQTPPHLAPAMTANGDVFTRQGSKDIQLSAEETLDIVKKNRMPSQEKVTLHPIDQPCRIFVAMSFHEEQEPALVDYYEAMKSAVKETELPLELGRMDLMEGDYEISQEIMNRIKDADVVIADFTLNSANVYFELGYARGCDKRVIQTARKDTKLEFDNRNWRTLTYKNATELKQRLVLELRAAHADIMEQRKAELSQ